MCVLMVNLLVVPDMVIAISMPSFRPLLDYLLPKVAPIQYQKFTAGVSGWPKYLRILIGYKAHHVPLLIDREGFGELISRVPNFGFSNDLVK